MSYNDLLKQAFIDTIKEDYIKFITSIKEKYSNEIPLSIEELVNYLSKIDIKITDFEHSYDLSYNPKTYRYGALHYSKNKFYICDILGLNLIDFDNKEK